MRERRLALIFVAVALVATGVNTAWPRPGTDDRAIAHVRRTQPSLRLLTAEERDSSREVDASSRWLLGQGVAGALLFWAACARLRKRMG